MPSPTVRFVDVLMPPGYAGRPPGLPMRRHLDRVVQGWPVPAGTASHDVLAELLAVNADRCGEDGDLDPGWIEPNINGGRGEPAFRWVVDPKRVRIVPELYHDGGKPTLGYEWYLIDEPSDDEGDGPAPGADRPRGPGRRRLVDAQPQPPDLGEESQLPAVEYDAAFA